MGGFNYVSLFSGIGGFEQALNKLGGTCVLASEIDKFANQAYEVLYGHSTVGDITKIKAEDIPDHDVLVGGFPCQAFSVAGKRGGFEDARGTLFFEMARIAKEKQPKIFLAENVKGLLSHDKGRTMDTIVTTLSDIGYRVDFEVLNSKYFGVPQNRERVFLIGIREDLIENESWNIPKGSTVVPKAKRRLAEYEDLKTFNFDWPAQEDVLTRLKDVLEAEVDEKYYLSEDKTAKLVAQLEATTGKGFDEVVDIKVIQQAESGVRLREDSGTLRQCLNHQHVIEKGIDNCESVLEQYKRFAKREGYVPELFNPYNNTEITDIAPTQSAQCSRVNNSSTVLKIEPQMLGHVDIKGHDAIKRVYSDSDSIVQIGNIDQHKRKRNNPQTGRVYATSGVSPTLSTMQGGGLEPKIAEQVSEEVRPVLTPDRMEKRQNGRRFKEDGEESFTLTAQDRHGVALRKVMEQEVREIAAKSRPNTDIGVTFKNNGDIRPHRTDERKSGISELQVNYEDNPANTVTSAHAPKVYGAKSRYRIRKLTPKECWRLQNFPDEAFEKVRAAGMSDSQLYKQAGNAVTVSVVKAIGEQLLPILASDSDE